MFFTLLLSLHFWRSRSGNMVCEPGNVRSPNSSINGGLLPLVSSFQISRLKEFQQTFVHNVKCSQLPILKHTCASPWSKSCYEGGWHNVEGGLLKEGKSNVYNLLDKGCRGIKSSVVSLVLEDSKTPAIPTSKLFQGSRGIYWPYSNIKH